MGYTHYWTVKTELDRAEFGAFALDVKALARAAGACHVTIRGWNGESSTAPEFNNAEISLNGYGEDSHESFIISQGDTGFQFCKTARKPYDLVVTAALCLFAARFGDAVEVSSDGTPGDWQNGLNLARRRDPLAVIPMGVSC